MERYAIITAGGRGIRMKTDIPKQFICIGNLPILMHSINVFYEFDNEINIILSLPENQFEYWNKLCKEYDFKLSHIIAKGGNTRFQSVKNALDLIVNGEDDYVSIHDGVRPLVDIETLKRTFNAAEKFGSAVAACDLNFSLRKIMKIKNSAVNRDFYKEIQTPQTFKLQKLKEAYCVDFCDDFTDDASVFEFAGHKIHLVKGNKKNIKITTQEDLIIAEALLNCIV